MHLTPNYQIQKCKIMVPEDSQRRIMATLKIAYADTSVKVFLS